MRPLAPGFLASGSLLALTACSPVEIENQSPTLSILEPAYAQVVDVGDTVVIRVEASDPDGSVAVVRFFVDGAFLGQDDQSPFEHAWNTEDEESWEHRIQVVAVDNRGPRPPGPFRPSRAGSTTSLKARTPPGKRPLWRRRRWSWTLSSPL